MQCDLADRYDAAARLEKRHGPAHRLPRFDPVNEFERMRRERARKRKQIEMAADNEIESLAAQTRDRANVRRGATRALRAECHLLRQRVERARHDARHDDDFFASLVRSDRGDEIAHVERDAAVAAERVGAEDEDAHQRKCSYTMRDHWRMRVDVPSGGRSTQSFSGVTNPVLGRLRIAAGSGGSGAFANSALQRWPCSTITGASWRSIDASTSGVRTSRECAMLAQSVSRRS